MENGGDLDLLGIASRITRVARIILQKDTRRTELTTQDWIPRLLSDRAGQPNFPRSQLYHRLSPPPPFPPARHAKSVHRFSRTFLLGNLTIVKTYNEKYKKTRTRLSVPQCALSFPLASNSKPGLLLRWQSGIRAATWVSSTEHFAV